MADQTNVLEEITWFFFWSQKRKQTFCISPRLKCSKYRPVAQIHARRRLHHWSIFVIDDDLSRADHVY